MKSEITICGLDCSLCPCFKNKMCAGCNACKGRVFHANGNECAIYNCCVTKNGFKNCLECKKIPCKTWEVTRDPALTDEEFEKVKKERIEVLRNITNQESDHFFFDGYGIDNDILKNVSLINKFIQEVKSVYCPNSSEDLIIPYFDGKVKIDGGISAVIVGDNFHFTCHTFSYKNTVFIDCFGGINCDERLLPIILKYFPTSDFDLCKNNVRKGNFGKQVIIEYNKSLNYNYSIDLVKKIVKSISMTPISKIIVKRQNEKEFDILQPIAESHISIHVSNNVSIIDVFSCKSFDETEIINLLDKNSKDIKIIQRGVKYK